MQVLTLTLTPTLTPTSTSHPAVLLAMSADPVALMEDDAFGRYGGHELNRFERMEVTVRDVLTQKEKQTENQNQKPRNWNQNRN